MIAFCQPEKLLLLLKWKEKTNQISNWFYLLLLFQARLGTLFILVY